MQLSEELKQNILTIIIVLKNIKYFKDSISTTII